MVPTLGVGLLAGHAAFAANILSNPGFEAKPAGTNWNMFGVGFNTSILTNASIAHGGSNYFKVFQQFTGQVNYSGIYQDNPTGPGATYSADGWAYTLASDALAGANQAWIEVTFRDFNGGVLSLYRSSLITTNAIQTGAFHTSTWYDLKVTNICNPSNGQVLGSTNTLVAPPGTSFVRCQVIFQGDANNSGGSVYFDDFTLNQTGPATMGYNIVWSDEFNGVGINSANWTFETGNNNGWGNGEAEYYTSSSQNAYVSNGLLHVVVLKTNYNGYSYTSARMKTQGLFYKKYGTFEFRAKLPTGQGYWPALWLYPESSVYGGWAASGEIDVMENSGNTPAKVLGTIHYGGPYPQQAQSSGPSFTFSNGDSVTNWHTYSLQWTTNSIAWLVDGQVYETQTSWYSSSNSVNFPYPAPFDQPFFIIMNVAIGGSSTGFTGGGPNTNTVFPGEMQVDYVRVYDFTPLLQLTTYETNGHFQLSWPSTIVCHLQTKTQINSNWVNLAVSSPYQPAVPSQGSVFFRLVSP